jgi:anti-anti-sigma factor
MSRTVSIIRDKTTGLEITIKQKPNGVTTVAPKDTIDAYSYSKLEETFNNLIGREAYKLIVDLSQVYYISSHGVRLLINMLELVQKNGGDIVLLAPKPQVKEVFELLGLNFLFSFAEDKYSAFKIFNQRLFNERRYVGFN